MKPGWFTALVIGCAGILYGCGPSADDISPDLSNGAAYNPSSYAGLILALAGDEQTLYAVSLNGGVWRSDAGGRWNRLASSPSQAQTIAVDPAKPLHILVGERDGVAADPGLNQNGLWESTDGGQTWAYVLDPRRFGCVSQVITSVVFDASGDAFAGTRCGVFERRAPNIKIRAGGFRPMPGAADFGLVTALATQPVGHSPGWLWARTTSAFYLYDGATWRAPAPIPGVVGQDAIRHGFRGDYFALAAFDDTAFTIVTSPRGNAILGYDADTQSWKLLTDLAGGSGTGLGGRRMVKAFYSNLPSPHWTLFAGNAQGLFLGSVGPNGTVWKHVAETPWGPRGSDHYDLMAPSHIHTDMWDAQLGASSIWVATDGGVYRTQLSYALAAPNGTSPDYAQQNEGLHTHHIHTLGLVDDDPLREPGLIYSSTDNDSWMRTHPATGSIVSDWAEIGGLGDASLTVTDVPTSLAISYRNDQDVLLRPVGTPPPTCKGLVADTANPLFSQKAFSLALSTFGNDQFFDLVQTPANAPAEPCLDLVALEMQSNPAGPSTVIVRARQFARNPDLLASAFPPQGWSIDVQNPPANAKRLWGVGAHNLPLLYYVYANDGGDPHVWMLRSNQRFARWTDLTATIGAPLLPYYSAARGPVFPDPYDAGDVYVLTATGARHSSSFGAPFQPDTVLTALITGSGTFPIVGDYPGGVDSVGFYGEFGGGPMGGSHALLMATLGQIAFDRQDPKSYVVAAPYTGVFYSDHGAWRDLTPYLPTPRPEVSSVAIDHNAVFVSLEGGGVWRIGSYTTAPLATYFARDGLPSGQLARLSRSDGVHDGGHTVHVVVTLADGQPVYEGDIVTDATGQIAAPSILSPAPGKYLVHLAYAGVAGPATTKASFRWP